MRTSRLTAVFAAAATAGLVGVGIAVPAQAAQPSLTQEVAQLRVAPEHPAGYDRDLFGDYDRDAALARNFAAWPNCDGYYSRYDGKCYTIAKFGSKARADDEVDIDESVARKEAWESGAYKWGDAKLDSFGGDPLNLSVMTDNLNSSKGDDDVTDWLPPRNASVCHYVGVVVSVKTKYGLTVDQAEKQKLTQLTAACAPASTPTPRGNQQGSQGGEQTSQPTSGGAAPAPQPSPVEHEFAVTG